MNPTVSFWLLLGLASLFLACQESQDIAPPIPDEIVLIFEQTKRLDNEIKLEYMDDQQIVRECGPDSSLNRDTIVIPTQRPQLEVSHRYRKLDWLSYIFHRGDTVTFSYEEGKPYAEILNREDSSLLVNYDILWRTRLDSGTSPAFRQNALIEYFSIPNRKESSWPETKAAVDQIYEDIRTNLPLQLQEEIAFLDSLKDQQLISEELYAYRKSRALFHTKTKQLDYTIQCFSRFETDEPLTTEALAIYEKVDDLKLPLISNVLDSSYDSLLASKSYRELLNCYFHYYGRKVNRLTQRHDHNGMPGAVLNHPDYRERYDSIAQSPLFSDAAKHLMLQWELKNIIENETNADKEIYLRRFEEQFADSAVMEYLHERYAIRLLDTSKHLNDLTLYGRDGASHLYQDVLAQHRGKVIYVDFWSSACRPCLGEMPDSHQLKADYGDKDVVFLYLSLDVNEGNWDRACQQFQIEEGSYLISNKFTSSELERLHVNWIPHYMIYDRTGELVVPYATRPSESETRGLLDRYLAG